MTGRAVSRRTLLAGAATLPLGPVRAQETGLAAIAAGRGLTFGSAHGDELGRDAAYAALVREQSGMLTAENAFKFDWLRPQPDRFDTGPADRLLAFAARAGLPVMAHALLWNDWPPAWLRGLSPRDLRRVMDEHIERVLSRFADRVTWWELVNEPITPYEPGHDFWRPGPWFTAHGQDYILAAFRRARSVLPQGRFLINEAFLEHDDALGRPGRQRLPRLIDRLLDAGLPLHGVGFQGHLHSGRPDDDRAFADFLHGIGARGLAIHITELDVNDVAYPDAVGERDRRVAERYSRFLDAVLAVPAVRVVTSWQLSDRYSWYRDPQVAAALTGGRPARPLAYDSDLRAKPARQAIAGSLARA